MLWADAEKANSLEDVIEELERLQHSEAEKAIELLRSQETVQVRLLSYISASCLLVLPCIPLSGEKGCWQKFER